MIYPCSRPFQTFLQIREIRLCNSNGCHLQILL
uniref:Uncharacterized protein n=1 Tax=Arundo donax TaxID=35708 RepID=A0A0A9A729_ARUDO